jgi:hypothetical protein
MPADLPANAEAIPEALRGLVITPETRLAEPPKPKPKARPDFTLPAKVPMVVPVARPATHVPPIEAEPEEEVEEPIFTRREAIAWGSSIVLYTLLLIVLANWVLTTIHQVDRPIVTELSGGSPLGDDSGWSDRMGGIEMPPEMPMPEGPVLSAVDIPPLAPTLNEVPDAKAIVRDAPDDAGGNPARGGKGKGGGLGGDGFGMARFGSGGETIQGVKVKVGDPQFTLIWDSKADIDLHVIEPGGSEYWWKSPRGSGDSPQGGELDVDDMDGFGPENVYWVESRNSDGSIKAKGTGPAGSYKWFVVYYGGAGGEVYPTRWKVRVKHNGVVDVYQGVLKFVDQKSKVYTLKYDPRAGSLPEPSASK